LTGQEWSSTQKMGAGGRPGGRVWYYNFRYKYEGSQSDHDNARALCVRG
jgi:hypothetical protein